ncbi:UDP-N-acetylmuramoyl-tripeptide--D-alanyl-D-alanine ligase [Bacillus luteolus]|uniref:UDP-N-acetylmuramoyl-tripeptide--D-alanyl-D-alanine ligase n=1 Tax=Litchfieldia luteola TaxID=682179 RepID=A0ABR9QME4_9BACI|nr:UDP-N-acetylmuramoyl-tripeptide--D-alanyl-D-alanine ligase [Cytobacillus luteolus]MBE4909678.1 UDP-N-acetylmuramoyl-tripeptide--D-alanyl-D-alanine ligase [Cytobacillus luteolus]MBP1944568.1 UDP-N-acetylmuramoyl-tripeptide--D-alanyl-D-alanine ligase [Cytobacillus luteolus]
MIKRSMKQIAQMVSGECNHSTNEEMLSGVSINSRAIEAGNLFVPIIGEKFNGHEFVEGAIINGAKASLWQRNQENPPKNIPLIYVEDTLVALQDLAKTYRNELSLKVIGITGSNGKTTTKDIVASIMGTTYKVLKTEGNLNNHYGLPLTILRLEEDTEVAVLEMGMSGRGEIELLTKIAQPDAAIITNIGEAHLLDLGSRDGIADAKFEIIDGLKEGGTIIYDGDETLLNERVMGKSINTITFGSHSDCTYVPVSIKQENDVTYFTINKYPDTEIHMPILGKHNVFNALAGIAVAEYFNVSLENIQKGLKQLKVSNMRLEVIEGKNGSKIINDAYNASPTAMKAAIDLVQNLKGYSRKVVVLGDMLELGPNEEKYHYEIGELLKPNFVDYVVTFGELSKHIAEGARVSFEPDKVKAYTNKTNLIEDLKKIVSANDLILVKGSRGMRLEEVVMELKE